MTKHTYYSEEEKSAARHTDIASFLTARGEQLKRSGSEFEWTNGCEKITIRGCVWFNHYRLEGGNAVDFVRCFYGVDYPAAMQMLLGDAAGAQPLRCEPVTKIPRRDFILPESNRDMNRVFDYLNKSRCIDRDVINYFAARHMLYEDEQYHNAVFVGHDEAGIPRHAHKRSACSGSSFKCNAAGSDSKHSFHHIGTSDRIYAFEAPIDMLSFISMNPYNWQEDSYVALCSVSPAALLHQLKTNPKIRNIYLCLDNDSAGISACSRIAEQLKQCGDYCVERIAPSLKDWNEDLCAAESVGAVMEVQ